MKDCPCKNCTKRVATAEHNCHSDCPDYADYKADLSKMHKYNCETEDIYVNYIVKKLRKRRKRKNEKSGA